MLWNIRPFLSLINSPARIKKMYLKKLINIKVLPYPSFFSSLPYHTLHSVQPLASPSTPPTTGTSSVRKVIYLTIKEEVSSTYKVTMMAAEEQDADFDRWFWKLRQSINKKVSKTPPPMMDPTNLSKKYLEGGFAAEVQEWTTEMTKMVKKKIKKSRPEISEVGFSYTMNDTNLTAKEAAKNQRDPSKNLLPQPISDLLTAVADNPWTSSACALVIILTSVVIYLVIRIKKQNSLVNLGPAAAESIASSSDTGLSWFAPYGANPVIPPLPPHPRRTFPNPMEPPKRTRPNPVEPKHSMPNSGCLDSIAEEEEDDIDVTAILDTVFQEGEAISGQTTLGALEQLVKRVSGGDDPTPEEEVLVSKPKEGEVICID